jgi:hypothetical protein
LKFTNATVYDVNNYAFINKKGHRLAVEVWSEWNQRGWGVTDENLDNILSSIQVSQLSKEVK